ncbi:MAG: PPC domain-containing protein [Promethearchaeota archaeon]
MYYSGEDKNHAHIVETNFPVISDFPTAWGADQFWEKIYVDEGKKLLLKLEFEESNNYDLYLYTKSGLSELASKQSNDNPEVIVYDIEKSDWYKILVDRVYGSGQFTLTTAIAEQYNPGDFNGAYTPSNLNQYYYVELKKGEILNINLECSGYRSSYVQLYLYDSNLNEIAKDTDGISLSITYNATEDGIYFFRIYNSKMGTGSIQGEVSVTPIEKSEPIGMDIGMIILIIVGITSIISIIAVIGIRRVKYGEWFWKEDYFRYKLTDAKEKLAKFKKNLTWKLKSSREALSDKLMEIKENKALKKEAAEISKKTAKSKSITPTFKDFDDITPEELKILKEAKVSDKIKDAEFWKSIEDTDLSKSEKELLKKIKLSDKVKDIDYWKKFIEDNNK